MDEIDDRVGTTEEADAKYSQVDLLPANPLRPLDWRWRRAGQLLEPRVRRRRWDDDRVARARRFRVALAKANGDVHHSRLARAHPEILGANLLRQGDPRRRWEVEARLLAGQADRDIADRVGVEAGVIGAYETLFFDVRSWLGCSDWISAHAIGRRLHEGFEADDFEILWKILAYQGGPVFLNAVIDSIRDDGRPPADPKLAEQIRLLIKVMTMPVTPENALQILRLDAQLRELDRAEAAQSVATVTRPLTTPPIDVHFGPETVPFMCAECAPDDPEEADSAVEGGPMDLEDVG